MKPIAAIKKFFDDPVPSLSEIKELSSEERGELGRLACAELGEEFEEA